MCEYCGCQALTSIDELTREHELVLSLISDVRTARSGGDVARLAELARRIAAVLGPHTQVEERGLFPALAPDFPDQMAVLEAEHRRIEAVLGEAVLPGSAGGAPADPAWPDRLDLALALLREHIFKEQDGVFPAALATLRTADWEAVEAARARAHAVLYCVTSDHAMPRQKSGLRMTAPFDTTKPNVARMYDYWLGGRDNFEVDRRAADAVRELRPNVAEQALDNKRFQTRAVSHVAARGVRQFLDIGSGLPTSPVRTRISAPPQWRATHEAAGAAVADPVVAYVDNDPVALLHSRTLLAGRDPRVVAVDGDMRDPAAILADRDIRSAGFDVTAPACVILACVLHFVDAATARGIMATLAGALVPGSYFIVSVGFAGGQAGADFARTYNAQRGPRIYAHSWEEITALFDGLELVQPGIVDSADWHAGRADGTRQEKASIIAAAVARLP